MNIRIVSVPPGEAPDTVRAAWVGLTLPLSRPAPVSTRTVGVRSGPRNLFVAWVLTRIGGGLRERGYVVDARTAIDILGRAKPEAAVWWREHAPHVIRSGVTLLFAEASCVADAPSTVE